MVNGNEWNQNQNKNRQNNRVNGTFTERKIYSMNQTQVSHKKCWFSFPLVFSSYLKWWNINIQSKFIFFHFDHHFHFHLQDRTFKFYAHSLGVRWTDFKQTNVDFDWNCMLARVSECVYANVCKCLQRKGQRSNKSKVRTFWSTALIYASAISISFVWKSCRKTDAKLKRANHLRATIRNALSIRKVNSANKIDYEMATKMNI